MNLISAYNSFNPYLEAILDFIYPPYCIICKAHVDSGSKLVCKECWQSLPRSQTEMNLSYQKPQNSQISCFLSVWKFSEEVQTIVHEMKYYRKKSLAQRMGEEMAKLVLATQEYSSADLIIPVPLHKTRLRERGFNQSQLLAQKISLVSKIPLETENLKRVRYTKPQGYTVST